jgi:hypothetical protein
MSSENIYVAAVEMQLRKNERRVKTRMKLNLAPKMEIGQKLELMSLSLQFSKIWNHDTPKSYLMKWIH